MKTTLALALAAATFLAGGALSYAWFAAPLSQQLQNTREAVQNVTAGAENAQRQFDQEREANKVYVLAAQTRLDAWTFFDAKQFRVERRARNDVPPTAIVVPQPNSIDRLSGRIRRTLVAGEVIREEDVLSPANAAEKGKFAISLVVSADKAIAFFITPGTRVSITNGKGDVLLKDVLVLGLEANAEFLYFAEDRPLLSDAWLTIELDNRAQLKKLDGLRLKIREISFGVASSDAIHPAARGNTVVRTNP